MQCDIVFKSFETFDYSANKMYKYRCRPTQPLWAQGQPTLGKWNCLTWDSLDLHPLEDETAQATPTENEVYNCEFWFLNVSLTSLIKFWLHLFYKIYEKYSSSERFFVFCHHSALTEQLGIEFMGRNCSFLLVCRCKTVS